MGRSWARLRIRVGFVFLIVELYEPTMPEERDGGILLGCSVLKGPMHIRGRGSEPR